MDSYFSEEYEIEWQIYCWLDENSEPYYVSKCRMGSNSPYAKRPASRVQPPSDRSRIKTLFISKDEREILEKLDRLTYELGLKDATEGHGTLRNSIKHSPKSLRERSHSKKVPVDVYKVNKEKVGRFKSIGDAVHCLGLNKGNAIGALHGRFYQTQGYCILYANEKWRKRPKTNRSRYWSKRKLKAYDLKGAIHSFDCVADAAEMVYGNRKRTNGIQKSLSSTKEWKSKANGLMFFEESTLPDFKDITIAQVGRPTASNEQR
ncbi:hypothetical protein KR100_07680 [Synechococcus sp. KORDI-100]|uniref:hypothetical protein n=1 Tax=Synechococcus sp. KORDI-100 TaxID=1280380 RepID=UPI0004E07C78|nr:hypothetical protein [Synechococcus sp. KORDI-100]AII43240.1 hypothetical protein KR100_07680 [Synechococcus sp. KORDI-100]